MTAAMHPPGAGSGEPGTKGLRTGALGFAFAYDYMNRADPDCGTSFTWVTRAMGPHIGWMTGWAIIVADIIVMASLAEVAAQYTLALFDVNVVETPVWPVAIGDTPAVPPVATMAPLDGAGSHGG